MSKVIVLIGKSRFKLKQQENFFNKQKETDRFWISYILIFENLMDFFTTEGTQFLNMDDLSRYIYMALMKHKSEAFDLEFYSPKHVDALN